MDVKLGRSLWGRNVSLRVLENRVLMRIFGPDRYEVRGEWIKLHKGELSYLCYPPNFVRVIKSRSTKWSGHVSRTGERRGMYRVLAGKPERNR
jgi:hypothetical protein